MNNLYIIPANTKNGKLIFNIFRPIDLGIALFGLFLTLILLFVITSNEIISTIVKILPLAVCSLLVVPIPQYHNVLCFIKDVYLFLANRRVYKWKGWCVRSEYSEEQ